MPPRTQVFQQLPWRGSLNTSVDSSLIGKNELIIYDNSILDTADSKKKREGIDFNWDNNTSASQSIIGLEDFHYEATAGADKTQRLFSLADDNSFQVAKTADGSTTALVDSGTAYSGTLTVASFEVINNKLVIGVDGDNNVLKVYDPQTSTSQVSDLGGTPPKGQFIRKHLGRLWANDKSNPDRLHYSTTGNITEWNGTGDSGAIDIGVGDGDPEGITAIFPTFKGDLYVAKKTKLYRVTGFYPETFQIIKISDSIGCVAHETVQVIGINDIYWASERGIHSLRNTETYGDIEDQYISAKIQRTFNNDFSFSRLKFMKARYLPTVNSYFLATTDTTISTTENNSIYIYHTPTAVWHRWQTVNAESLCVATDTDKKRLYFGTHLQRIAKSFTGADEDTASDGTATAIDYKIKTGRMSLDDQPYTLKAFKRLALYYKPSGNHNLTVNIDIDSQPQQSLLFTGSDSNDVLGSSFVLGSSLLGVGFQMEPNAKSIDGLGRFIQLEIFQMETDEDIELQGFAIEYEPAGPAQETALTLS